MAFLVRPIRVACAIIGLACAAGALAADQHDLVRGPQGALAVTLPQAQQNEQHPAFGSPAENVRDEAHGQPDDAARFFLGKRLTPDMTEYPTQQILDAYQQSLAMPLHSTVGGGTISASAVNGPDAVEQLFWGPLGPGNIGGRTRILRFLSGASVNMVAAGAAGGVWKTANSGASWAAAGDLMANLAVNALAVDPFSSSVMLAGTGEGYFNVEAITGAGIFKTTNSGANWTQLASTANSNFSFVNDLVYKPGSSIVVYAATRTGLWRSLDSGTSWTQMLNATSAKGCTQVVYRNDADTAVASCGLRSPNDAASGIWVSTNASAASPTWTHIIGGIGSGATNIVGLMGRISLAIAPSNQAIIYALVSCSGSPGAMCGHNDDFNSYPNGAFDDAARLVMQSTNGGLNWTFRFQTDLLFTMGSLSNGALLLSNAREARKYECLGFGNLDLVVSAGGFDNVIAVDPLDPTKVWVGGIDLFRSDDSGATWGVASYGWKDANDVHYVHASQQGIFFDPGYNGTTNQNMFVTNGGGIFKTTNARAAVGTSTSNDSNHSVCGTSGLPAVTWSNLNNGFEVTQFYHGSVYPDGTQYFGGTQDNGVVRGTDGNPNGWTHLPVPSSNGTGGYTAINRTTSGSSTVLYAEDTYITIKKSLNNGASFFCSTNGIIDCTTGLANDYGQFINPFTIDPNNFQNLWTSGRFLWRSTDAAFTWVRASANTLDNGSNCGNRVEQFSALRVANGDSNLVVAGTDCGFVYVNPGALSATSGTSWQFTHPRTGYVADIAFDPNDKLKVYAVYSTFGGTHVWKSTNGGQTFAGIDGTGSVLPNVPVTAVAVSPFNGNTIYIGTDIGVFLTNDGGANWARENTGFANAPTESLVFNASGPTGQEIYAFTHGRGVFRAPVSNLAGSTTVMGSSPNPSVYGQSVTLSATVSGSSGTPTGSVDFYDGATLIDTGVLVAGATSINTTTLSAGTHNLSAVYAANATYSLSIGVHSHTVNKASTATTMIGDTPDPTSVGENVKVTASVAAVAPGAGTPTGNIQVTSTDSPGCTIVLPATFCNLTFTKMGAKTINGAYAGDGNFNASLSVVGRPHQVDVTDTTTTITSDNPDPSAIGQAVTVAVSVVATPGTGSPSSGTVTVTGTNTTGCTFNRPNTSCNLTFTATGAQTLNASYAGNADYFTSATLSPTAHSVVGTATTTTISVHSPDPAVVGQPVAVTATVSPAGATGTITVTGTNTTGCTISLPSPSCNATFTAAGAQTLSASYGGDAGFASSATAAPTAHTVNKAATTLSIIDAPDPANVNALVTITATLTATGPGAGTPTGTIEVTGSNFPGCTITLPSTSCAASFSAAGVQTLDASYSGDANFAVSNATQIFHNDQIFESGFDDVATVP